MALSKPEKEIGGLCSLEVRCSPWVLDVAGLNLTRSRGDYLPVNHPTTNFPASRKEDLTSMCCFAHVKNSLAVHGKNRPDGRRPGKNVRKSIIYVGCSCLECLCCLWWHLFQGGNSGGALAALADMGMSRLQWSHFPHNKQTMNRRQLGSICKNQIHIHFILLAHTLLSVPEHLVCRPWSERSTKYILSWQKLIYRHQDSQTKKETLDEWIHKNRQAYVMNKVTLEQEELNDWKIKLWKQPHIKSDLMNVSQTITLNLNQEKLND